MAEKEIILLVGERKDAVLVRSVFEKHAGSNVVQLVRDKEEAVRYLAGEGPYSNRAEHPLPDLIVVDLKDGFDLVNWMREREGLRAIPVVGY